MPPEPFDPAEDLPMTRAEYEAWMRELGDPDYTGTTGEMIMHETGPGRYTDPLTDQVRAREPEHLYGGTRGVTPGSQPHPVSTITEPELAASLASVSPGRPVTPAEEARLLVQHAEDTQDRDRYRRTETDNILRAIEKVDQHLDDAAPAIYRQDPAASAELNEARGLANMWRRSYGGVSEAAETQDALVGMTGGNPRKGVYATEEEMRAEAGDTAVAALLFIQSRTKDTTETWRIFRAALAKAESRVPGERPSGPVVTHNGETFEVGPGDLDEPGCEHEPEGREIALSDPGLI